jgi:hypothetical protein
MILGINGAFSSTPFIQHQTGFGKEVTMVYSDALP